MIGVTIHQRKPRSEQQYITLSHGDESQYITPDGIQIVITKHHLQAPVSEMENLK